MKYQIKKIIVMLAVVFALGIVVSEPAFAATSSSQTELLTQKQRKNLYASKTNPAKGTKVVTPARAAFGTFMYADFSTFNNYNSDNKLGGTPIYLLGTIADIAAFTQVGNTYGVALMINDCDGYQWYGRVNIDKSNFDMFKATYLGQTYYLFGTAAGYSGVMNRPMMDVMMVMAANGQVVNFALYNVTNTVATVGTANTVASTPANNTATQNTNTATQNTNATANNAAAQNTNTVSNNTATQNTNAATQNTAAQNTTVIDNTSASQNTTVIDNTATVQNTNTNSNQSANNSANTQATSDPFVICLSKKMVHKYSCSEAKKISNDDYMTTNMGVSELKDRGFSACSTCKPF